MKKRSSALYTSERVPEEVREQLTADLGEVIPSIGASHVIRHKSEPSPSFIHILLEAKEWITPLRAAAIYLLYQSREAIKTFFNRISERAADELIDDIIGDDKPSEPSRDDAIQECASALAEAIEKTDSTPVVRIGLPIPNDYFGTWFEITEADREEISLKLALFVLRAEQIQQVLKQVEEENSILGPVEMTFLDDGHIRMKWKDQDFSRRSVTIKLSSE